MPDQAPAPHPAGAPPRPWLLADLGGTHARFAWVPVAGDAPEHVVTLRAADHPGPAEAARAYLETLAARIGGTPRPAAAAFAVATPVRDGEVIAFTNNGWTLDRTAVQRELGLQTLRVLNDFEALALALPRLAAGQLQPWPGAPAAGAPDAARAVLGPGTGLGVAGLLRTPAGWQAVPGEGGHATLAPADDFESALLAAVRREHAHVSAERLLSGTGLPLLHEAVAAVRGEAAGALDAAAIVAGALAGDAACGRTAAAFCALLGGFAGSVALVLGARGGVYVGGGIVPRLGERFFASRFRERFEAKGRFSGYLAQIPTAVIVDTMAALTGCAQALQQHRG